MGFSFKKLAKRAVGVLSGKDLVDSLSGKNAAARAEGAQQDANAQAQAVQRSEFDKAQETLKPYVQAGIPALAGLQGYADAGMPAFQQQQDYLGLSGPEAQQEYINQVSSSPEMAEMVRQGEAGILQNQSATGGLRGGDTQRALSEYRPQVLQDLLDQRYSRLGGIASVGQANMQNLASFGQASATGQANQNIQFGENMANLYNQRGANAAGREQAVQQGRMGLVNNAFKFGGAVLGGL